ncbi:MAG: uracil-DNA glycosylase family protein [Candidatus Cloacimonas sp.]
MENLQTHPYKPFLPAEANTLLLGSAPPYRFCTGNVNDLKNKDINYYYGSNSNLLWDILFLALEPENKDSISSLRTLENDRESRTAYQVEFMQNFLSKYKLGMADILLRFTRQGTSAADFKLQVLEYQDIWAILQSRPTLEKILCTSKNRVHYWLVDYLQQKEKLGLVKLDENQTKLILPIDVQREIKIGILPSPSARSVMRFANKEDCLHQIAKIYAQEFKS